MSRRKQLRPFRVQDEDGKLIPGVNTKNGAREPSDSLPNGRNGEAIGVQRHSVKRMKNSYTPIDEEPKLDDCHEAICTNSQTPNSFNGKTSIDSSDKQKVESSTISTRSASVRVTKEDDDSSAKDLTLLQSTLFTLQNQQLYQMQLIEKLQSQLVQTQSRKSKNRTKTSTKIAIQDTDENNQPEKSSTRHCTDDVGQEAPDSTIDTTHNENRAHCSEFDIKSNEVSADNISSTLASSIITNHDQNLPYTGESSLELLQKRAEEVLDSASQSFSTGNLIDELSYRTGTFLEDNAKTNDPILKHRCRYCGKIFGSDSALQIHLRSHTGERPFKCLVCASRFTTKGNLKVHYQRHTETMNPLELTKFYSRASLDLHGYSKQKIDQNINRTAQIDDFESDLRNEKMKELANGTESEGVSSKPLHAIHDLKSASPFYSQDLFSSSKKKAWEKYMEIVSTPKATELQQSEAYRIDPNKCPICNRILSCRSALRQHYRTHTGERPFRCRLCNRSFTTKGNLKTHIGVHKINPLLSPVHNCTICHKNYSTKHALQQHINTHTGAPTEMTIDQIRATEVRDYVINNDIYGSNSSLGDHSETSFRENSSDSEPAKDVDDSTENSHIFEVSGPEEMSERERGRTTEQIRGKNDAKKSEKDDDIKSSINYQHHEKLLDTPPSGQDSSHFNFLSKFSPMLSATSIPLPPHILAGNFGGILSPGAFSSIGFSTGVRGNTTCNICFKTFACHSALEIHYRSHTKEKPFICQLCNRGFSTKGNMKQHMLTHKIRDMPQHVFRNTVTQSSPSSDSNNSLSALSGSQMNKLNRLQPQQQQHQEQREQTDFESQSQSQSQSESQCGITNNDHKFDDTRNADRLRHQLNASNEKHNSDIEKSVNAVKTIDQSNSMYLSSDESVSMSSPIQPSKSRHLERDSKCATDDVDDECKSDTSSTYKLNARRSNSRISVKSSFELGDGLHKLHSKSHDNNKATEPDEENPSSTTRLNNIKPRTMDNKFRCTICKKSFSTKDNLKTHIRTHKDFRGTLHAMRTNQNKQHEMPNHFMHANLYNLGRPTDLFDPFAATAAAMQQKFKEMNSSHELPDDLFRRVDARLSSQDLYGLGQFPFQMFSDPMINNK